MAILSNASRRLSGLFLALPFLITSCLAQITKPPVRIPALLRPPTLEQFEATEPPENTGMVRVEGLLQRHPKDGALVSERTIAYIGYDKNNFYAAFICYMKNPEAVRA